MIPLLLVVELPGLAVDLHLSGEGVGFAGEVLDQAGTLYGALNSLQEKGWIAPFGDSAGRKKEYLITTQGKEIAEKELIRLNELVGVANGIIGGAV